ncbi:MAG TPA: alpha-amylase family glycosyl hydrolase, partial [Tepidisphaeraceae bacterium]|nr:alpha-amylase family glycosyl hydrolase [Tepidisphaeraceae bacterium]
MAMIRLENEHIALEFDPHTSAWTALIDKRTGENLVASPAEPAPAGLALPKVDQAAIAAAIAAGDALSIEGTWRFTPEPANPDPATFSASNFDDRAWQPTPIPSRGDTGDRMLKDQIGAFWYRTKVSIPARWHGRDLAIVMGAVDDYDTTYFNGQPIGATAAEKPRWWETPRRYIIPSSLIRFGAGNTIAIRVVNAAALGGIFGSVALGLADALPPIASPISLVWHRPTKTGLSMTLRAGPYLIRAEYTLDPHSPLLSRRFTIENATLEKRIVRPVACALPSIAAGQDAALIVPDSLPVGDQPVTEIDPEKPIYPTSQDGLVYLYSASAQRGLGAWFHTLDEYAPVSIARDADAAAISHNVQILATLAHRQNVQLGAQFIWLAHGPRSQVLQSVRHAFAAVNLKPPSRSLPNLSQKVIYCCHPGGTPETHFRGHGGFKSLQAYLPTLKKMGIDLIWLLPIYEHGDGQKWNLYSPFDQFKISSLYGTEQELKDFADAARREGMHLLFDLVPHGPPEHTPLGQSHPNWVCLDEDQKPTHVWGQLAFDNAHPQWQAYMGEVAIHHATRFGIIGARMDVAAGSPPNWNPNTGHRPSRSTLGGGLGMARAIRQAFLSVRDSTLLLPEEYTGCRAFHAEADLTYDVQLFFLLMELQHKHATPHQWAATLQRFLEDQRLTLPPSAIKMRWIANHDTVLWHFQKKRPREAFGPQRARALLALCCLIDGVPMIYQGEEDPRLYGGEGEPITDFIAKLIACRKRLQALREGESSYDAVHASSGVFACLRQTPTSQAIILISFRPE